jgi:hypothetical protein
MARAGGRGLACECDEQARLDFAGRGARRFRGGAAWYHSVSALRDLRARELEPLVVLLKEDEELLQVLQADVATD